MAATKCSVTPDHVVHMREHRSHRNVYVNHRKSAVELLQASKATYVKSTAVLNHKQELKHPENLSIGNRELISVPISLYRHSLNDEPLSISRENSLGSHSDDNTKRALASIPTSNNNRYSQQTCMECDDSSPLSKTTYTSTRTTDLTSVTAEVPVQVQTSSVVTSSNSSCPTLMHSSTNTKTVTPSTSTKTVTPSKDCIDDTEAIKSLILSVHTNPSKPAVVAKPGFLVNPATPPKPGPKPMKASISPTGNQVPPPLQTPSHSRISHSSSYDVTDSSITMATTDKNLSNSKASGSPDQCIRRFSTLSTDAAVNSSKDQSDKDFNMDRNPTVSNMPFTPGQESRYSLYSQGEGFLKPLSVNILSTSVGVLAEKERAPIPKPRIDKQLNAPGLPPRHQLHRSQSDLSSCRHSRTSSDYSDLSSRISRTSTEVERFFNEMGIDRLVLEPMKKLSDTKQKECLDSLSSLDSIERHTASSKLSNDMDRLPMESEQDLSERGFGTTSVVERNARIIKWLCNVRKASGVPTKANLNGSNAT